MPVVMSSSFSFFSFPEEGDGFDKIIYAWQPAKAAAAILNDFVLSKKLTERVDDLVPGKWFLEEWKKWNLAVSSWKKLANDWKDPTKRKALLAKKANKDGEGKKEGEEEKGEPKAPMEINMDDLDVFAVEDITDVGNGQPLFANFQFEDWTLLSLRYELFMLVHSFRKDMDDADRPGFTENHLLFYYQKYFKKTLNVKFYGVSDIGAMCDFVKDSVSLSDKKILQSSLSEETPIENFVKMTEDARRERERRLDAGDEAAQLKFNRSAQSQTPQAPKQAPQYYSAPRQMPQAAQKRPMAPTTIPGSKQPRLAPNYTGYIGYKR